MLESRRMKRSLSIFSVIAALALFAQSATEVDITAEPHHHLVLQNKYVRVFKVEVPPQQSTLMHRHPYDYAYVTLGAVDLVNDIEGRPAASLKLQDGETRFSPRNFAHAVRDLSSTPFRNVTIEFLQGRTAGSTSAKWAEDRGLQILNGGTEDILFVKDDARTSDVLLNPHGTLPKTKSAAAELIVAVTELSLQAGSGRGEEQQIDLMAGDIRWLRAAPSLVNVGARSARFICFQFH